jgi:SAM-dependent methyltransferase
MPLLSQIARQKRIDYFFRSIPISSSILEIGAGSGWAGSYLRGRGYANYIGMDLEGDADVKGDIKDLASLPLHESQFDVIGAFEVLEHIEFLEECRYLLKDGGLLMLTTPLPQMDWLCYLLEKLGINQKRTSPHCNLKNIRIIPGFSTESYDIVGFMGQWGIFRKLSSPNAVTSSTA